VFPFKVKRKNSTRLHVGRLWAPYGYCCFCLCPLETTVCRPMWDSPSYRFIPLRSLYRTSYKRL